MKTALLPALACVLTAIAACSSDAGPPTVPKDPPGFLAFSPTLDSLLVGDTAWFYAYTRDSQPVSSWTVSDSRVATILQTSATGLGGSIQLRALHQGTATVTAVKGDTTASGVLVVESVPSTVVVTVTPSLDTAIAGNSATFTATVRDSLGNPICCESETWSVSDTSVARLFSTTGASVTVGASKPGSATVVATRAGRSGSAQFVVIGPTPPGPVASVTVTPGAATLPLGATCVRFTATLRDAQGVVANGGVAWTVSDPSVASIEWPNPFAHPPSGCGYAPRSVLIWTHKPGSTVLTATSGAITGTAQIVVTPPPPVASVTVAPSTDTVVVGDSGITFTAAFLDAQGHPISGWALNASGNPVTWSLSDTSVVRIQSAGTQAASIQALKAGSAVLTVSSEGRSAAASVLVEPVAPVGSVTVAPALGTLVVGDTAIRFTATLRDAQGNPLTGLALHGQSVAWTLSDTSVAHIVSAVGAQTVAVQGVRAGSAALTATCGGKSGSAQLVVAPDPLASVTLTPSAGTAVLGDTSILFTATLRDAQGNTLSRRAITWTVGDTTVANISVYYPTVQRVGIRGLNVGATVLTAASGGQSASANVTVAAAPPPAPVASVTVSPAFDTLSVGDSATLAAILTDSVGTTLGGRSVTWSVGDPSLVRVLSASGQTARVYGLSAGSVGLTATSEGKSGAAQLFISHVAAVTLPAYEDTLSVGDSVAVTATPRDAQGNALSGLSVAWSVSDSSVVRILRASGQTAWVRAVKSGIASLTATCEARSASLGIGVR